MPVTFMKLRALWERCGAQRWMRTTTPPTPPGGITPKPFEPLTPAESRIILDEAIRWLNDEARTTLAMPNCPFRQRRWAELLARDQSMVRDFHRLSREG
jgi:hypothetical protein